MGHNREALTKHMHTHGLQKTDFLSHIRDLSVDTVDHVIIK